MATPGSTGSRRSWSENGAGRPSAPRSGSLQRSGSKLREEEESPGMYYELTRLRNELRAKDRELEEKVAEIRTVKAAQLSTDRALEKAEGALAGLKDRLLGAEGDVLSLRKSLARAEAERDEYRAEAEVATREADRLSSQVAVQAKAQAARDTGASLEVARLEVRLAELRQENQSLADDNKACHNVMRAREKELARLSKKVAEAEEAVLGKREADNVIADLRRQLGSAQEEIATLQKVQRLKDAEAADAARESSRATKELTTTSEYLAAMGAELQVTKQRLADSRNEAALLRDELARVSAVASRVARAEYRSGSKDEGTIPMLQHLEEVKYMQGEIHRLKLKLEHSEKSVHSAQQQKERLYRRLDALAAAAEAANSAGRALPLGELGRRLSGAEHAELEEAEDFGLGSPRGLISELRSQLAEAREAARIKEEEAVVLTGQLEERAQRLEDTRGQMVRLKGRLCEVLGDDAYTAEFGEPPVPHPEGQEEEAGAAAGGATKEAAQQQAAEVAAELQQALQDLAQRKAAVAGLQHELEQARQAAQEADAAREDLQNKLHAAESTADAAAGEVEAVQQQLEEAQSGAVALQEQLRAAEAAAGAAAAEAVVLQQQLGEVRAAEAAAAGEAAGLRQQLEEAAADAAARAESAASEAAALQEQLEAARGEVAALQQQLEAGRAEAAALREQLRVAESTLDAASGKVEALQEQLAVAQAALAAEQGRVAELQAKLASLQSQLADAEAKAAAAAAAQAAAKAAAAAAAAAAVASAGGAGLASSSGRAGAKASTLAGNDDQHEAISVAADVSSQPTAEAALAAELEASRQEVAELRAQLAAQAGAQHHEEAAEGEAAEENEDGPDSPSDSEVAADALAQQPSAQRGDADSQQAQQAAQQAAAGMSAEALADLVERLVAQRERERREGAAHDDGALFEEMVTGLKAEMARLGKEMIEREAAAERLRHEVGSLEAAKLTAEAMASRLEEMNALSMRVAALKLEMQQQAAEAEAREAALLEELAALRGRLAAKKPSPTKALKKTLSQAAKGFKESLSGQGLGSPPPAGGTPGAASAAAASPGASSRKLPFTLSKRRDSAKQVAPEEEVVMLPS